MVSEVLSHHTVRGSGEPSVNSLWIVAKSRAGGAAAISPFVFSALFDPAEPEKQRGNDNEFHQEGEAVSPRRGAALDGVENPPEASQDHDEAQGPIKTGAAIKIGDAGCEAKADPEQQAGQIAKMALKIGTGDSDAVKHRRADQNACRSCGNGND